MNDGVNTRQSDHMSFLATWVLNTLGKALALSTAAALVVAVVAVLLQEPLVLAAAGLVGPLVFAAVLYNASAPLDD